LFICKRNIPIVSIVNHPIITGQEAFLVLTLQIASVHDLESLAQLYAELVDEQTDFCRMRENFKLMESNPNYIVLTAKDDNLVVGSAMGVICLDLVGKCIPFMVIENVVVKIAWRGKGIGAKLMGEIEGMGRKRKCYYTMFVSGSHRKDAHRFYESIGYDLESVQGFKKYL